MSDTCLQRLRNWLGLEGNRQNLFERPKVKLEEYSRLEVRRFSNLESERIAGYVRVPPLASLRSVSIWHQARAALDLLSGGDEFDKLFRIATSYEYWYCLVQIQAFRSKYTNRCLLLRNDASLAFLLTATCNNRAQAQSLGQAIWRAHLDGMLHDAGSKVGPFGVALIGKWLDGNSASPDLRSIAEIDTVDSSGALALYQEMLDNFDRSLDELKLRDMLVRACNVHIAESRSSTNQETHDFELEYLRLVPYEVFGYIQMLRWVNGPIVELAHPLIDALLLHLPLAEGTPLTDQLLDGVLERVKKTIPGLASFG